MSVSINEPIDVIVLFQHGKILPKKFNWRGKVFTVDSITISYTIRDGKANHLVFAALSGTSIYELVYQLPGFTWRLRSLTSQ